MPNIPHRFRTFAPLSLAAYGTFALVVYEQLSGASRFDAWAAVSLAGFLAMFIVVDLSASLAWQRASVLAQLAFAWLNMIVINSGSGPILGVLVAAQLPFVFGIRAAAAIVALSVAAYGAIFWADGAARPWFVAGLYGGFQCFALLAARLAATAERQRDELAQVNAHLVATRHLLEAGARDGERLRLSRELHDVAGHGLTALKLNLELALRVPETERASRVAVARDLVDGLLDDLRRVVGQLRRYDGVDLEPALRVLAGSLPGLEVQLDLEPGLRIAEVQQAQALLRCVQEALTNAARHAQARRVRIHIARDGDAVRLTVHDDGRGRAVLVPGNGLIGMRERIEEAGGTLDIDTTPGRGVRVVALLPRAHAA